jgi:protein-tyrosine phosphatase
MMLAQAIQVAGCGDGNYEIGWTPAFTSRPVEIYVGNAPDTIDMQTALVSGATGSARISGLAPRVRHYFRLCPRGEAGVTVAQRNVPLVGGVNFRDLGGYATADGRHVVWGRLYRSGHMSNLSTSDKASFAALDIHTVCDFRLTEERADESIALPNGPRIEVLEIPPGVKDRFYFHRIFKDSTDPEDVVRAVHDVVRSMVDESAPRYRRLFEVLLEPGDHNILINCSAGKERTGVGAALILTALGVPRETIYYDFMLSRVYFPVEQELGRVLEKYAVGAVGDAARRLVMPLLETRRSYLRAAFDFIDENFGGGIEYLTAQFGLDAAELRYLRDRYTH